MARRYATDEPIGPPAYPSAGEVEAGEDARVATTQWISAQMTEISQRDPDGADENAEPRMHLHGWLRFHREQQGGVGDESVQQAIAEFESVFQPAPQRRLSILDGGWGSAAAHGLANISHVIGDSVASVASAATSKLAHVLHDEHGHPHGAPDAAEPVSRRASCTATRMPRLSRQLSKHCSMRSVNRAPLTPAVTGLTLRQFAQLLLKDSNSVVCSRTIARAEDLDAPLTQYVIGIELASDPAA